MVSVFTLLFSDLKVSQKKYGIKCLSQLRHRSSYCEAIPQRFKTNPVPCKRVPKNVYWERLGTVPDGIVPKSLINAPNVDREDNMTMMKIRRWQSLYGDYDYEKLISRKSETHSGLFIFSCFPRQTVCPITLLLFTFVKGTIYVIVSKLSL